MSASKSVWIICQHAGAPKYGMNYRPYNLGRELSAQGVDVTIIGSPFSHQFFAQPKLHEGNYTIENIDGMRYCWIRTADYPESQSLARVRAWWDFSWRLLPLSSRSIELGIPAPDTILVSSPPPYAILPASRLAKKFGSRLVFEARDLWPLSLIGLGGHSPLHPFILFTQWVENFAYKNSDAVVSVPPLAEPYMQQHGLKEKKFYHIPNGVNTERESLESNEDSSELIHNALPGKGFIVGYSGTVGLANGLSYFVDAAELVKGHSKIGFAIIGDGADIPYLEARAREKKLENIAFIPAVSKTKIPSILTELDACFLSLKREKVFEYGVSPTKLFDYLLAAKPVIMAVESGNDIVGRAGCGIKIEPENPNAIAEAILFLSGLSAEERKAMGNAGEAFVLKNHDWRNLGKMYAKVLEVDVESY